MDLQVSAEDAGSGPAAALAHRVIREAVVNVARHAPGASAAVRVHRSGNDLSVEVVDDGSHHGAVLTAPVPACEGSPRPSSPPAENLNGGHRELGGFRVAALIPQEQP